MKKAAIFSVSAITLLTFVLAGCGAQQDATIYLLSSKDTGSLQKIGCEEYLVPVPIKIDEDGTIAEVVEALLEADPTDYGPDLMTATAFKDGYIQLSTVKEPAEDAAGESILVHLKTATTGGIAGVCDVPRIQDQMTETIRAYAEKKRRPFQITLDGSPSKWKCLGDQSGTCK